MTNNPMIDGVSRELLERLLTDACNENWSDLNDLLHSPDACRCRRFGKDNPHWPCPVHSAHGDQHGPTAAMTEAGCQAYMDADGMIGIMHNSSMGHAYVAMRALDPEVAAQETTIARLEAQLNNAINLDFQRRERITQLESEKEFAAATYQAARDRIAELESGRGEPVTMDGKTTIREYVADSVPEDQIGDDWTKGYEECKRRIHRMFQQPVNACLDATAALNVPAK